MGEGWGGGMPVSENKIFTPEDETFFIALSSPQREQAPKESFLLGTGRDL